MESTSDLSEINVGLPQGSVPGPKLFLLFHNEYNLIQAFLKLENYG